MSITDDSTEKPAGSDSARVEGTAGPPSSGMGGGGLRAVHPTRFSISSRYLFVRRFSPQITICISILLLVGVWQALADLLVRNPLYLPSFTSAVHALVIQADAGTLRHDIFVSFVEFILGFISASVAGIVIGGLMAQSPLFGRLVSPWVSAANATPVIALGPLFVLWLGLGITSKAAVVMTLAIFPVIMTTYRALSTTERSYIEAATSFGASKRQMFFKVHIPASLPIIIAGERLAAALALIGVVVAEFFGAQAGLGYMIFNAANTFDTPAIFGALMILSFAGILMTALLSRLERQLAPWRAEKSGS